jgi:hypothetical protein
MLDASLSNTTATAVTMTATMAITMRLSLILSFIPYSFFSLCKLQLARDNTRQRTIATKPIFIIIRFHGAFFKRYPENALLLVKSCENYEVFYK